MKACQDGIFLESGLQRQIESDSRMPEMEMDEVRFEFFDDLFSFPEIRIKSNNGVQIPVVCAKVKRPEQFIFSERDTVVVGIVWL